MESSRRDLFKTVAEHWSFLKNHESSTYYPRFGFTEFYTQNRYSIPQNGGLYLLCVNEALNENITSNSSPKTLSSQDKHNLTF